MRRRYGACRTHPDHHLDRRNHNCRLRRKRWKCNGSPLRCFGILRIDIQRAGRGFRRRHALRLRFDVHQRRFLAAKLFRLQSQHETMLLFREQFDVRTGIEIKRDAGKFRDFHARNPLLTKPCPRAISALLRASSAVGAFCIVSEPAPRPKRSKLRLGAFDRDWLQHFQPGYLCGKVLQPRLRCALLFHSQLNWRLHLVSSFAVHLAQE